MDAAAYLKSHGWQGAGHSLDQHGRGIKKPLLISQKPNVLGLGKAKSLTSDQWWLRAFNDSLQDIGTGKESALSKIRTSGVRTGGLYGFFVKGESLHGTIRDGIEVVGALSTSGAIERPTRTSPSSKRKRGTTDTDEDRRKRRKREKAERTAANATTGEKARADGVSADRARKERKIERRVKQLIRKERAEGKYGLTGHGTPSKEDRKAERRIRREAERVHRARLWAEHFPGEESSEGDEERRRKQRKEKKKEKKKEGKKEKSGTKSPTTESEDRMDVDGKPEKSKKEKRKRDKTNDVEETLTKSKKRREGKTGSDDITPITLTSDSNTETGNAKKLERYVARAAEKGMTVEQYIARRKAKKGEA